MPEQATIQTLYNNKTDEAIAPRTVISAISGTGSEGQLVGFTGKNTIGLITSDTTPTNGSNKPITSGTVYNEINKLATKTELQDYLPISKESEFATKTQLQDYLPASKEATFMTAIAQCKPKILTLTLTTSDWASEPLTQTVPATGVLANETAQLIIPTPAMTSLTAYYDAGVKLTAQTTDQLTFTADSTPESDLTVYVAILPTEAAQ